MQVGVFYNEDVIGSLCNELYKTLLITGIVIYICVYV